MTTTKKFIVDFNEYRFTDEEKEDIVATMESKIDQGISIFDGMYEALFDTLDEAFSFVDNCLSKKKKDDKKATILYQVWEGYIDEDGEIFVDSLREAGAAQL